ncbi:MAG TPA: TIM barrel protein [Chloroflexota bacterium]|nr:TIM barrel protein [Chloroflexota bacterium]
MKGSIEDFPERIGSIYGYTKVGIVHFKAFPETVRGEGKIVETLAKIAEDDFFTAVEVGWMKDVRVRNEARKLLEESHLAVYYATQPAILSQKLSLNALDPAERRKALNQVKNCVNEAYDLGARAVRLIAGKDPGAEKRPEAMKMLVDSIHQICEYAKEEGEIGITLKIFDRDIDKENLIGPFSDARALAMEVVPEHPNFGLLADLSHFPLLREKPEEAIPLIKPYLRHAHIGNCIMRDRRHPVYGDLQPRFGIPGGEIDTEDVADYFNVLWENGFFHQKEMPVISAEVRPLLAGEREEVILANAKRVFRESWAMFRRRHSS